MKKTPKLKQLINASEILISPGTYDCLSDRLIAHMGFKTLATTGAGISEIF